VGFANLGAARRTVSAPTANCSPTLAWALETRRSSQGRFSARHSSARVTLETAMHTTPQHRRDAE